MARETKVGLLIGIGVILLIGIIISDHLSVVRKSNPTAALTEFGNSVQNSIYPPASAMTPGTGSQTAMVAAGEQTPVVHPVPTPAELDAGNPMGRGTMPGAGVNQSQPLANAPSQHHAILPPRVFALDGSAPIQSPANNAQSAQQVVQQANAALNNAPQQTAADNLTPFQKLARSRALNQAQSGDIIYTVKPGQSLYEIAKLQYGNGGYWKSIAQANPKNVGPHGQVKAGAKLLIPNRAGLVHTDTNPPASSATPPTDSTPKTITVHPGDTLAGLAKQYLGHADQWHALMKANAAKLSQPEDLQAGMTLILPAQAATTASTSTTPSHPKTYTVRPGDTLMAIAQHELGSKDAWHKIFQANQATLKNPGQVRVGQTLVIP